MTAQRTVGGGETETNKSLDRTRKPDFYYETDAYKVGPLGSFFLMAMISLLGTFGGGKILGLLLWLVMRLTMPSEWLDFITEWVIADHFWGYAVFEPILIALPLLWLVFDVRNHVKSGTGSIVVFTFARKHLKWKRPSWACGEKRWIAFVFTGETSCFRWFDAWVVAKGFKSVAFEITGVFEAKDENGIMQPVTSRNGGPPKVEIYIATSDPFKQVDRVDQAGAERQSGVIHNDVLAETGSIFTQAIRSLGMSMKRLMTSDTLNTIMMGHLLGIKDDNPSDEPSESSRGFKSYYVPVDGRLQWVYEMPNGVFLYDPRVNDMGLHPDIVAAKLKQAQSVVKALGDKQVSIINAEAKKAGLALILKVVGQDMEKAMLVLDILNGDEYKVVENRLTLMGLTGEQQVRVAESLGEAGAAVGAYLANRGGKGGDQRRRPRRGKSGDKGGPAK